MGFTVVVAVLRLLPALPTLEDDNVPDILLVVLKLDLTLLPSPTEAVVLVERGVALTSRLTRGKN